MANAITGIRIVCALLLIFCPTFSGWFYFLYLLAGISDILDGMAARHFQKETTFGSQWDTLADVVFFSVIVVKIATAVSIPIPILGWIGGIVVLKIANIVIGFVKYHRFVAVHSVLNKICGLILFFLPLMPGLALARWITTVILVLGCLLATVSAIDEGIKIVKGNTAP